MTPQEYKHNNGLIIVDPNPYLVIIATTDIGSPKVWVKKILTSGKWIVTDSIDGFRYMFKDLGVFGYTENPNDRNQNSFDTMEEAYEAFLKFYQ